MSVALVTVVLPTYNRRDRLARVLTALEAQSFARDRFEVVVVSDGSTDGTGDFMRTLQSPLSITFVEQPNQGVAVARNAGIARASGDLILFLDDDVVPAPTLMDEHVKSHGQDNLAVLGPMLTPPDFAMKSWVQWEQRMLMKQYDDMHEGRWQPTARQFYTGNTSIARRHLVEAGGFDPTFRRAEDVELAYRLARQGVRFVFNRDAVGWHYAERSFASWRDIPYTYGRNDVIFARDKGERALLTAVYREFHDRHPLVRALTRLCLDRPRLTSAALGSFQALAGSRQLSRMAFSAIFNLRYYQGMADELGGRSAFFVGVAGAPTAERGPY